MSTISISSFRFNTRLSALAIAGIFFSIFANAQVPAFPGAEGYGKYSTGGRGTVASPTTVYEVTNLNDDNAPGSLRYALTNGGNTLSRTVVFRVAGTIRLTSQLTIRSNTTIAGQTAPGGGICIADYPVVISGDNVIIRYVRFRMGDRHQNLGLVDGSGNGDVLSNLGNKKIIIDHCSISWSSDEALTIYRGDSITLQWNIVSEPLNYSYHYESPGPDYQEHGYGGIWGSRNGSFHHNLIMHVKGRAPRFAGNSSYPTGVVERGDFRNNVIYNWIDYSTNGGEGGNYNLVNNYYKYGPSTGTSNTSGVPKRGMIMNPSKSTEFNYPQIFLDGNHVDGYPDITANNWKGMAMAGGTLADTVLSKATTPFAMESMPGETAVEAYQRVLALAGAILPERDTLDQRLVNDVANRTGRVIDVQGGFSHGTPFANTVNAWPALASGTAPADTDHDGMPDTWEQANGLNPNDPSDRGLLAGNGYTNLENYLNGIVNAPAISVTGSLQQFQQYQGLPSAVQQYTVSASSLNSDLSISAPAGFELSADGNNWVTAGNPLTITPVSGTVNNQIVRVRLNAASTGSVSGNIMHSSTGAPDQLLAVSGNTVASVGPPGVAAIVAADGSGQYSSIQAAINAAPSGLTSPYIIFIRNGRYKEKITIPSNKPFIHLVGESVANVFVYYTDGASTPAPGGGTLGTQNSASFTVNAPDFAAFNITFANTFGDGSQAVAVLVNNDRAVFYNCRFLGNQDTLYIKGGGTPRHYFRNCYIDGNVDFIFGSSVALFDSTVVYAKSRSNSGNSYITAANTPAGQAFGYVFRDCDIPDNTGATAYFLGRPWQNSNGSNPLANNKTVFLNTRMGNTIRPEGWSVWDAGTNTSLIYYGEYNSTYFNGTPVNTGSRAPWSFQLNATEASGYSNANLFGSWDPCSVSPLICAGGARDIAVANFRGVKQATNSLFNWNISWAMNQISYELFRSSDRNGTYAKVGEVMAANGTLINFQLTDELPVAGSSYFYYLRASKAGYASHITDTIEISSIPTILASGTLQPFIQNLGEPSSAQTVTIAGNNITGVVKLETSANFEISNDGGINWTLPGSAVILTPTSNTVAASSISIRMNAAAVGDYTDSLVLSSDGADTVYVALSGTTAILEPSEIVTLLHWPFTQNGNDSAQVRSPGVMPGNQTFYNLYLSNGTTVPNIPSYSPQYGQAFGATSNGDGSWGTAAGGPGGTLRRTFNEEFTVTASNGYRVKVDSIYITGAFYNTSSNTRLAVVYSTDGFVNDSSDVFTIPGGFANPASLANQTSGPTNTYALSVAGLPGVTLEAGQSMQFRLYFSCGSSSPGRYAMLKDVRVVGEATDLSALPGVLQHWPMTQNASDSATVRSPGVLPSSPQFQNLYVSNGTTVPTIANYSAQFGQAFGATSNGDGSWGTGVGGPGGTLRRNFYEEFTVTAQSGYELRIDSLYATAAFYNTSSGTRLAVVYSRDGFVNDSSDVFTIPGGFSNPASLANQTQGPSNVYAFSVAGPDAVVLAPGEKIWLRFYFSCSSSSPGRYAMLKDVKVTGVARNIGVVSPAIVVNGALQPFQQNIGTASAIQTYTVEGTNLQEAVTITPPAGFEISADGGANWFGNANPLLLEATSGTLAATNIQVRLNAATAGNFSGDITHSSLNAEIQVLPVTGTAVNPPVIMLASNLSAFSQTIGAPSATQSYNLSAQYLTAPLVITVPAPWELSIDAGTNWINTSTVSLQPAGGEIATLAIQLRLNSAVAGSFNGSLMHASTGAVQQTVALTGTAVNPPTVQITQSITAYTQTLGTPSASQLLNLAGNFLAGPVTITPPENYEVSINNINWFTSSNPLQLTGNTGSLANTVIRVRLNANAIGTHDGTLRIATSGLPDATLSLTGYTYSNMTLAPNPAGNTVTLYHPQLFTVATINLYNLNGIKLATYRTQPATGSTQLQIAHLPAGMYVVEYRRLNERLLLTLIKQ